MRRRGPPCPLVWNAKIIIPARGSRRMTTRPSSPLCTMPKPELPCPSPPALMSGQDSRLKAASAPLYPLPSRQRVHYGALLPITNKLPRFSEALANDFFFHGRRNKWGSESITEVTQNTQYFMHKHVLFTVLKQILAA